MNDELKKAIEGSKLLSDEQKKRFVEAMGDLSPEQVKSALKLVKDSEMKYAQLLHENQEKKIKIQENYLEELKHLVPRVMKKIEITNRSDEINEAEASLSQLDNL